MIKSLYERYQHLLAVLASKTVYSEKFPTEVRIETINSCNSTCSFCPMGLYSPETKNRKVVKMDESLFKKIIAELVSEKYNGMLKFYTENEPLLDKRIVEFVRYANENLPSLKGIQIDTNGKLLTESLGVNLFNAGLTYLHVNDYTETGGGGLNNKKEPIKKIYDKLRLLFPNVKMTYSSRLIHEVLDSRAGHAPNNDTVIKQPIKSACVYPFYQFCITSNGNLGLCCVDSSFEEPLGNVKDSSISEIWKGDSFNKFRNDLLKAERNKNLCSQCTFFGHMNLTDKTNSKQTLYKALSIPDLFIRKLSSFFRK